MNQSREGLHKIVKTVASPLRFFAVAVICLTLLIGFLSWKSLLPSEITQLIIVGAFAVLLVLILVVTMLVIFAPHKLVFDQEAHLTVMRERLGDSITHTQYRPGQLPSTEPSKRLEDQAE